MTATAALASFAAAFDIDRAPDGVAEHIELDLIDTIGAAVAAIGDRTAIAAADVAAAGTCMLWATGRRGDPAGAAFANAALARTLDYDDIYARGPVHVGAAVAPAVLAIAEHHGRIAGRDVLAALAVGGEVQCRLGDAAAIAEDGRRPSALTSQLTGYFAAAAGAARAMRLDERATARALGLALMYAAGTMAAVARDGKALYMGASSQGGVHSARLAAAGVEVVGDPIGGRDGLFERHYGTDAPLGPLLDGLGGELRLLGLGFKPWPGTKVGHPHVEAALELRSRLGADCVAAADIEIEVGRWGWLFSERGACPRSAPEARNSLPWLIACALVRGEVGLDCFEPSALDDARLGACAARVRALHRPELSSDLPYEPAVVRVRLADGAVHAASVEVPLGDRRRPLGRDRLERKLHDCCARAGSRASAERIRRAVAGLRLAPDVAELVGALSTVHETQEDDG